MEIQNPNKVYHSGNKIVYSCQYHVIFCTKYRKPMLILPEVQEKCKVLLDEVSKEHDFQIIESEVLSDHVHLLLDVNPRFGVRKAIKLLKGRTSKVLRDTFNNVRSKCSCLWSSSYFVSSVGSVSLEVVKRYIEAQKIK